MRQTLRNITVIDGTSAPPIRDATIDIDDDVIVAVHESTGSRDVAARSGARSPDDHRVIDDLAGMTVIPGLVDAHVHLVFTGSDDPRRDVLTADDEDLVILAARNARTALMAGVTTMRDCGSRGRIVQVVRDEIDAGHILGPRILAAGPPICASGGHLWFMGGALDARNTARNLVERRAAEGADFIKVMASGGHMTPGSDPRSAEITLAELTDLVAAAHDARLRVAAHAHSTEAIIRSVAARVDTIEHCSWLGSSGFDYRPDVVDQIVDRDITVSPTVSISFRRDAATVTDDPVEQAYLRDLVTHRRVSTGRMHRHGVRMIIGTDAGTRAIGFRDFPDVMSAYTDGFGFTNLEAVRSATSHGATALGLADRIGTITPGMQADLVVLEGDPSVDMSALRRVRRVYKAGRCVVRDGAPLSG